MSTPLKKSERRGMNFFASRAPSAQGLTGTAYGLSPHAPTCGAASGRTPATNCKRVGPPFVAGNVILLIALVAILFLSFPTQVLATRYAGEPFSLGIGARPLGRGGAYVAAFGDASSVFWNPAALVDPSAAQLVVMHAETFGALLNHDVVGFVWPGRENSRFAFGAMFYYLGGGGIAITDFDTLAQRPYVLETRGHGDYMLGTSVACRAGDNWSWGVTGKFILRDIAAETAYGIGLDAGARWQPLGWAAVGMKIADVTGTYLAYNTGTTETIVPHVNWGGQADYVRKDWTLTGAAEAETFFENRRIGSQYWAGSVSVDTHFGLEVGYRRLVFGRIGADVGRFTAGLGARLWRWDLDLAFLNHEELDNSYRISLGYRFR